MGHSKWLNCLVLITLIVLGVVLTLKAFESKEEAIDNLFKVNLAVKKSERVLVFVDDYNSDLTDEARLVAKRGANFAEVVYVKYPRTEFHGAEPPKSLWEKAFGKNVVQEMEKRKLLGKILQKKNTPEELEITHGIVRDNKKEVVNAVIGLAWYSTTHTSFRKLLTDSAGVRYASMPMFDPRIWKTAMTANWEEVAQRSLSLKEKLEGSISYHLRTPNGTDMSFDLRGRGFIAETGLLVKPGNRGNLPAGELAISPVEGNSKGTMVIEPGANPTLKGRVVFEVKDGKVANMTGDKGTIAWLESTFQKYPLARNIAEVGIGTNEKAKMGTTLLELEKILGTIHIGIGDNSGMGGEISVPFHVDFLFENPTLDVQFADGKTLQIMKDGKLVW